MIILHGLFGMSDNWVSIARRLEDKFQVYLPDLRNHGQSPHSSLLSYPAMAEDILEFIASHHLENPILLGRSMGGKVAMLLAIENPNLIDKLIVVDIGTKAYQLRDQHLDILQVMMDVDLSSMKSRMEVEDYVVTRIVDARIQLFILKNLYRPSKDSFAWRINLQAVYDNLDLLAGEISSASVYPKPCLFIRGSLSDYILNTDIPIIKAMFPQAFFSTIQNAGHWVQADQAEELLKVFTSFIQDNQG